MPQDATFYRTGLIEAIILLLLVFLSFGALTVVFRERWLALGVTESLLARLAAAIVVASIAVTGLSGVVLNLLQSSAFSDTTLSGAASRNQALLGIALTLAVTIVGIVRIETYHRRPANPSPLQDEDDEWKVEPRR
jgi:hypothetical protein